MSPSVTPVNAVVVTPAQLQAQQTRGDLTVAGFYTAMAIALGLALFGEGGGRVIGWVGLGAGALLMIGISGIH